MVRAIVALLVAAAAIAPAAAAGKKPRPVDAATQQYVEVIPTASGNAAAGQSSGSTPLGAKAAKRIRQQAGSDSSALQTVATSSAYGAPTAKPRARAPHRTTTTTSPHATPRPAAVAAPPAVASPPATHWSTLVAVLVAIVAAGLGGAILRARRRTA